MSNVELDFSTFKPIAQPQSALPTTLPAKFDNPDLIPRLATNPQRQAEEYRVRYAAHQIGLDPHLAAGVAMQESGFNPQALSPTGVRGTMQVTKKTARSIGYDRDNPDQNIIAGVTLLKNNPLNSYPDPKDATVWTKNVLANAEKSRMYASAQSQNQNIATDATSPQNPVELDFSTFKPMQQPQNIQQIIGQAQTSQRITPPQKPEPTFLQKGGKLDRYALRGLLPTVGSALGGIAGGSLGGVAGGIGAAPGAISGAALGGAGGNRLEALARYGMGFDKPETVGQSFKNTGQAIMTGALQETTGLGLGPLASIGVSKAGSFLPKAITKLAPVEKYIAPLAKNITTGGIVGSGVGAASAIPTLDPEQIAKGAGWGAVIGGGGGGIIAAPTVLKNLGATIYELGLPTNELINDTSVVAKNAKNKVFGNETTPTLTKDQAIEQRINLGLYGGKNTITERAATASAMAQKENSALFATEAPSKGVMLRPSFEDFKASMIKQAPMQEVIQQGKKLPENFDAIAEHLYKQVYPDATIQLANKEFPSTTLGRNSGPVIITGGESTARQGIDNSKGGLFSEKTIEVTPKSQKSVQFDTQSSEPNTVVKPQGTIGTPTYQEFKQKLIDQAPSQPIVTRTQEKVADDVIEALYKSKFPNKKIELGKANTKVHLNDIYSELENHAPAGLAKEEGVAASLQTIKDELAKLADKDGYISLTDLNKERMNLNASTKGSGFDRGTMPLQKSGASLQAQFAAQKGIKNAMLNKIKSMPDIFGENATKKVQGNFDTIKNTEDVVQQLRMESIKSPLDKVGKGLLKSITNMAMLGGRPVATGIGAGLYKAGRAGTTKFGTDLNLSPEQIKALIYGLSANRK